MIDSLSAAMFNEGKIRGAGIADTADAAMHVVLAAILLAVTRKSAPLPLTQDEILLSDVIIGLVAEDLKERVRQAGKG